MDSTMAGLRPERIDMAGGRGSADGPRAIRRVAVYCRVSTDMEVQEGSFEMQAMHYRELVDAREDMALVDVYGDKGRTGRSMAARPDFMRMLSDCEAGRIDCIITKSISRFARNMGECMAVLRRLRELGVTVMFEKENISSGDVGGELMLGVLAAMAQEESNSISQNQLWAMEQHNASGRPHFKPSYGYSKARNDWHWHIDEAQARRVRAAFALVVGGGSYAEIRNALNAIEQVEGTGQEWTHRRVKYLLTNCSYTGDCLTNKSFALRGAHGVKVNEGERAQYRIEGHHAPLVSREEFELVQQRILSGAMQSPRGR